MNQIRFCSESVCVTDSRFSFGLLSASISEWILNVDLVSLHHFILDFKRSFWLKQLQVRRFYLYFLKESVSKWKESILNLKTQF